MNLRWFLWPLIAACLTACTASLPPKSEPPTVDCSVAATRQLPEPPQDYDLFVEWVSLLVGAWEREAAAAQELARCIEEHRQQGVIR